MTSKPINRTQRHRLRYCSLMLVFISLQAHAASTPPKEHIHFLAEHMAEAIQDARYFAMPWPTGDYGNKRWTPLVSVAGARVDQGFATANGQLLSLGLSKNWSDRWNTQLVTFYDRFHIAGGQTHNSLLPFNVNGVPLDLPETAIFSGADGEFTHTGVALIVARRFDVDHSDWRWDMLGGVISERLKMENYTFNYELTGGLDAGTTGVLDHSGDIRLTYYVVGVQASKFITPRYRIVPRFIYGQPSKAADMDTRLTGPGFELTTASTGAEPGAIGDPFGYAGMTFQDTHSGFEMDIGATLGYAAFEYLAHEGINSAWIISFTWRMP